jgi:hypothetical protein
MSRSEHSQRDGSLSLIAIIQMLGGGMSFAVMNGIIKWLGQRYDVPTIFLWRSGSAFLIILPLLCLCRGVGGLRTGRLFGHSVRGVFGIVGTLCFFWTMTQLPLGTAVTLAYASPVFMLGIAVWVLGEPASWTGALLALLGFCGGGFNLRFRVERVRSGDGRRASVGGTVRVRLCFKEVDCEHRESCRDQLLFPCVVHVGRSRAVDSALDLARQVG